MEKSIFDLVVDDLVERQRMAKAELQERFKRSKPFRMEPIPPEEMLYEYNTLTPEKMNTLIDTYGRETVNEMIFEMEQLKQRRQKNA